MIEKIVISVEFVLSKVRVDWRDVLWAFEHKLLGWKSVVQLAEKRMLDGSEVDLEADLAFLGKENAERVGLILRELASAESSRNDSVAQKKWLYVTLAWLFENSKAFSNPLSCVEDIYADFDYPEEIAEFVGYMPPTDGYDPSKHSPEENKQRMLGKWEEYLKSKAEFYQHRC
ncbi:DUF2247 family protein [Pelagibius sp. Alg239-R121]|uniref:DUF2247 family protein n=1 Tax=Pelagibius sp. Alg239-R121 TaxID=2993448 RepID=UPI0024A7555E|nr:DUF2247 family protein [Pelagibius sp. Alg239-R121]